MPINFDLNRGLENRYFKIILPFLLIALIGFAIFFFFVSNKHHKLPGGIEANIPQKDSNQYFIDSGLNKSKIIQNHSGSGDNVGGDKIINKK